MAPRVGDDAKRFEEPVWILSEGNPFIALETARALLEGRTLDPGRGLVPDRVRELIVGRLERLSHRAHELVAVASVIGQEFDFALLQRASGLAALESADAVEELVRRRVLHGTGERFDFTHDRIREVAYAALFPPRRKLLHGRVAEALETLHAGELTPHAAALGLHWREAEGWERAVRYFRLAGSSAATRFAHREAVTCFDEALTALRHLGEDRETAATAIDLRLELRNSLYPLGEHGRILECLEEARGLAEAWADRPRLGRIAAYLTHYFSTVGDGRRAVEAGAHALELARTLEDVSLGLTTRFYLAQVYAGLGDYRRALTYNRQNLAQLEASPPTERAGQPPMLVISRLWLLWCLAELGEFDEGSARAETAIVAAERAGQPFDRLLAYLGAGLLHLRRGEFAHALERLESALTLCSVDDLGVWFPSVASPLGYANVLWGRLDRGLALLQDAVDRTTSRIGFGHALRLAHQAEAWLVAGRIDEAAALARQAHQVARDRGDRAHEAYTLRLLGEIAAPPAGSDEVGAAVRFREALELAEELGLRPLAAHCQLALGRLARRTGDHERARTYLQGAADRLQALGMRPGLEAALAELSALA